MKRSFAQITQMDAEQENRERSKKNIQRRSAESAREKKISRGLRRQAQSKRIEKADNKKTSNAGVSIEYLRLFFTMGIIMSGFSGTTRPADPFTHSILLNIFDSKEKTNDKGKWAWRARFPTSTNRPFNSFILFPSCQHKNLPSF